MTRPKTSVKTNLNIYIYFVPKSNLPSTSHKLNSSILETINSLISVTYGNKGVATNSKGVAAI